MGAPHNLGSGRTIIKMADAEVVFGEIEYFVAWVPHGEHPVAYQFCEGALCFAFKSIGDNREVSGIGSRWWSTVAKQFFAVVESTIPKENKIGSAHIGLNFFPWFSV